MAWAEPGPGPDADIDPITLAVIEARLNSVTVEMGIVMTKTARSAIFSQAHDFSCFLADRDGQVLSQADGIPIHTGSGGFAIRGVLRFWGDDIAPGDIFLLNDPYVAGGNHLPDWTLVHPVFVDKQLVGFTANRAHQADIGGGAIGTYNPNATEIFHEGVRLPALKIVERGGAQRDLWELLRINCRLPEVMESDLSAMIGSARVGARRLLDVFEQYGQAQTERYFRALLDFSEQAMRRQIEAIPDGTYVGVDYMNNDCFTERPVRIQATVTVSGSEIMVDFAGTDPQISGFKNSALTNTHSAVYLAISTLVDPGIPHNEGTYWPIRIVAPEGSVVNAVPPAPVTYSTVFPAHEIIHAIWRALGPAVPSRASAGWGKNSFPISGSADTCGEGYVLYHWNALSGAGAVEGWDGFQQCGPLITLGGLTIPNLEVYEQLYPVRFLRNELRLDGGGAGRWRGGAGMEYVVRFEEPSELVWRGEGFRTPTGLGILGGRDGQPAEGWFEPPLQESPMPQYGVWPVSAGTTMYLRSPGGGGYGPPWLRPTECVLQDLLDGVVSVAAAADEYGLVVDPTSRVLDAAATAARRAAMAQSGTSGATGSDGPP